MTLAQYAAGLAYLALFVVPLGAGAWAARALIVPEWRGAPARLAEAVLTVGALILVSELLGAAGQFHRVPLALSCVALGTATLVLTRSRRRRRPKIEPEPRRRQPDLATLLALAMSAVVAARWWAGSLVALDSGITEVDSRQYHLPVAAFFAQTGSTVRERIGWFDPAWSFHPAHAELVHAVGMVAFRRDVLSPVLNMGWLFLALLAGWCIGRRWGAASATLAATALLLGTPLLAAVQSGSAANDIVGLAFFLSAVALLVTGEPGGGGLALAGFAAGLAVGTKLSFDYPVAGLTIAAVVLARRHGVVRAAVTWGGPLVVGAAFWYVRNLVVAGNPVPAVQGHVGPLTLHGPAMPAVRAYSLTVLHYARDGWFWRTIVRPALHAVLGSGWIAIVGLAIAGAIGALFVRRDMTLRLLALTAFIGFAGYVVTPGSAYGVRAELFGSNVRYALPALSLALLLFPLLPPLRRVPARRAVVVGVFAVLLVITLAGGKGVAAGWPGRHRAAAFGAGLVVLGLAVWLVVARRRLVVAGMLVGVLGLAAVAGYRTQHSYLQHRYTALRAADRWARDIHHARIGMTGYAVQYPLFGLDLTNRVEYVGRRVAYGGIRTAKSCPDWRRLLNQARYDYVVTGVNKWGLEQVHEGEWTSGDPNAVDVSHSGDGQVFALRGPLDPAAC